MMDHLKAEIEQLRAQLRRANSRISGLETKLAKAKASNHKLKAENKRLCDENQLLRQRVQHLESRLSQNSSNSHRPPSTDDTFEDPENHQGSDGVVFDFGSSAKQGAQPGHKSHPRDLLAEDEVDEAVEVKPARCDRCDQPLLGDDIAPWRHQVFEIDIRRRVTEYRCHRLECKSCGHSQRAELPDGVPQGAFGDRLCAWAAWLSGRFDLSKRDLESLINDGFKIPISLGSVCGLERRMQAALKPAHAEALAALADSEVLWVDETGWFEQNERSWMWTAVADDDINITAFQIDANRSRQALETLVDPDFEGVISSDRYSAYNARDPAQRQLCWQHLIRDFRALMARDGPDAKPARQLLTVAWWIFWMRKRIRRGEVTEIEFQRQVDTGWRPVTRLILERAAARDETSRIFKNLLDREVALWTFVHNEKVEPTNNRAERAVRPAVIKRKISFGTQSASGSRFIERILTVCETLRRQKRNVIDFLIGSLTAWRTGQTPPMLVLE